MVQILKKISVVAIAVIAAIATSFMAGCQKDELYQVEEKPDWETEMWAQSLFDDAYSAHIITTTVSSDGVRTTRYEPIISSSPRLKSGTNEGQSSTWIYWGIVKNPTDATKMFNDMKKIYGAKCCETRSEPVWDSHGEHKGYRKMYHRPCQ